MASSANPPACSICGKPFVHALPRTLYGFPVCAEDHQSFMVKRIVAHLIDVVLYSIFFAIALWGFIIVSVIIVAASSGPSGPSDRTADFVARLWVLMIPLGMLGRTLVDGFRGHSPGKAMLGLQVVEENTGRPIGFFQSFQRNLPLLIPLVPLIVLVMLLQNDGHRLGDGWAHTKVIWKDYRHRPPFQSAKELRAQARARITTSISSPTAPTA